MNKSVLRLKPLLKIKAGPLLEKDRGPVLGDLHSEQLPKHLPPLSVAVEGEGTWKCNHHTLGHLCIPDG